MMEAITYVPQNQHFLWSTRINETQRKACTGKFMKNALYYTQRYDKRLLLGWSDIIKQAHSLRMLSYACLKASVRQSVYQQKILLNNFLKLFHSKFLTAWSENLFEVSLLNQYWSIAIYENCSWFLGEFILCSHLHHPCCEQFMIIHICDWIYKRGHPHASNSMNL